VRAARSRSLAGAKRNTHAFGSIGGENVNRALFAFREQPFSNRHWELQAPLAATFPTAVDREGASPMRVYFNSCDSRRSGGAYYLDAETDLPGGPPMVAGGMVRTSLPGFKEWSPWRRIER